MNLLFDFAVVDLVWNGDTHIFFFSFEYSFSLSIGEVIDILFNLSDLIFPKQVDLTPTFETFFSRSLVLLSECDFSWITFLGQGEPSESDVSFAFGLRGLILRVLTLNFERWGYSDFLNEAEEQHLISGSLPSTFLIISFWNLTRSTDYLSLSHSFKRSPMKAGVFLPNENRESGLSLILCLKMTDFLLNSLFLSMNLKM